VSAPESRRSIVETVQTTDGFVRHAGRDLLVVLYNRGPLPQALSPENAQVQKALDDLVATTKHLLDVEREIELRMQGEFIFVNSTRLRLDSTTTLLHPTSWECSGSAASAPCASTKVSIRKQLQSSSRCSSPTRPRRPTPTKVLEFGQKLSDAGATFIGVEPPLETDEDMEDVERQKEAAKRTYARSVAVTKEVINSIRMGRTANVKR